MGKRDPPRPHATRPVPFNPALAGLADRVGEALRQPAPDPRPPAPRPAGAPSPARAVVRMERAGRGGKTVTVVEKLDLPPPQLEAWLKDLKRALGCGGVVEGAALVLQGDTRERTGKLLEARGVRRVTVA
jgi:translation initiation factor 1